MGPIPLGPKNIVSCSASALIVAQGMQFAGLISSVPFGIMLIGGIAVTIMAVSAFVKGLFTLIRRFKSPEEQVKEIFTSKRKVNRIVSFPHGGKKYRIRFAHDPDSSSASIIQKNISARFIIAAEPGTPQPLVDQVEKLLPADAKGVMMLGGTINGVPGIDYCANA